jgi:transposase
MCLYVRSLKISEGKKIQSLLRHGKNRTVVRRAHVILLSEQGMRASEIAVRTYLNEEYTRRLIRRFNAEGLKLFEERPGRGRPTDYSEETKAEIKEIAQCPPSLLRQPFTRWSLEKLSVYLKKTNIVSKISIETLRQILREERVSLQRTKTWKESNDPAFESKKTAKTTLQGYSKGFTCHLLR